MYLATQESRPGLMNIFKEKRELRSMAGGYEVGKPALQLALRKASSVKTSAM